ncbi:MAG: TonB-dependent receptor [Algibacter sp.]|uniref:TonB-dependent receptor n=1 Tax=Algibacter sp. TaxID=1872428 RepID=UPI002638A5E0|nr:TonB-dependent receptor [Algibacter sp.]MDG1731167.1 TonB-dependent receptor [Algibacter sp.]MDG2178050.1 TonB-dependent receptor [Algibacter sp.]
MKNLFLFLTLLVLSVSANAQQNQKSQDSTKTEKLDEVLVNAVRVNADSPITHSNVSKEELAKRNLGQDIPVLLNYLPSVVTTSDAGAGIGYTGIRIRGVSSESTNITINGIPYNDAESLGTFWVNLQDFSSSIENLQVQRGVGTSTNGSGAFGASVNILTDAVSKEASASISNSYGSFNSLRHNVKFSTGLLNDHIELSGRLSKITSDGFIDRASSDLKSYFLQGTYKDDKRLIKALAFGGQEVTYQAWYGVDVFTIDSDRTYNVAGTIMDDAGIITGFYDDQVDNYKQDHYQLHWNERFDNTLSLNIGLNYTNGRGFYEEYIDDYFYTNVFFSDDSQRSFIGLNPITVEGNVVESMDYARRRWLDNNFYVANASLNYKNENLDLVTGGSFSLYEGDHFGEVIWAQYAVSIPKDYRYYFGQGIKRDASGFAKATYQLNEKVSLYGDVQYRHVDYKTTGIDSKRNPFEIDETYNFINPKVGVSINLNEQTNVYASYARANREPSRTDFENSAEVNPEQLNDFELGYRYASKNIKFNANAYLMYYNDQLVLTGAIDDVGAPIRANAGEGYRAGFELEAVIGVTDNFSVQSNATISRNRNLNKGQFLDGNKLGETDIAYSPDVITTSALNYTPIKDLQLSLIGKYVGEQLMNNIGDKASNLEAYSVVDFNLNYEFKPKAIFKSILINGMLNNVLGEEYNANGFDYGGGFYVYYPQARTNFLVGVTLKF